MTSIRAGLFLGFDLKFLKSKYNKEMEKFNYLDLKLLIFDGDQLIGAPPVSPTKTRFKVNIDDIGSGYALCAVDALGIAYIFEKSVTIEAENSTNGLEIELEVDLMTDTVKSDQDYFVTFKDPSLVNNTIKELCPLVKFYSDKSTIHDPSLNMLTIKEALLLAKSFYNHDSFKKRIK